MQEAIDNNHWINYDNKERFCSYWHQLNEIISLKPQTILEIGVGTKFVSDYLRKRNFHITTVDIDLSLKPDVNASVLSLPFIAGAFELISCCEVLEHLPFTDFSQALGEIFRCCKKFALLSLPDVTRHYRILITLPKFGIIKKLIDIPKLSPPVHILSGEHYWEIGKRGYPLSRIKSAITQTGFSILRTYRVFENPYHRFFVLKKT
ncbi:MAG: methyltransferase domain-containing protein [Candidatus Sumerlaeia bacterium]|nr:methyltransferase domain-containing protein [Candidatus Sumerlaeia bacterium]